MIADTETPDFPGVKPFADAEADLRFLATMLSDLHEEMPEIRLSDVFAGSELIPPIVNQWRKGGAN